MLGNILREINLPLIKLFLYCIEINQSIFYPLHSSHIRQTQIIKGKKIYEFISEILFFTLKIVFIKGKEIYGFISEIEFIKGKEIYGFISEIVFIKGKEIYEFISEIVFIKGKEIYGFISEIVFELTENCNLLFENPERVLKNSDVNETPSKLGSKNK